MKTTLIIAAIILSILFVYQLLFYSSIEDSLGNASIVANQSSSGSEIEFHNLKSIKAYSTVIERPLFSDDRRPPKIIDQSSDTIDMGDLEDLILIGVVISNDNSYAIIADVSNSETIQVKTNHQYKGWEVTSITPDSVNFENDEAQFELFLSPSEDKPTKATRFTRSTATAEKKKPQYRSIFRSVNKSPIKFDQKRNTVNPNYEPDDEDLDALGNEGGYEFNEEAYADEKYFDDDNQEDDDESEYY